MSKELSAEVYRAIADAINDTGFDATPETRAYAMRVANSVRDNLGTDAGIERPGLVILGDEDRLIQPLEDHVAEEHPDWDYGAFTAYLDYRNGDLVVALADFENAYEGHWDSLEDFWEAKLEDIYGSEYRQWLDDAMKFGYLVPSSDDIDTIAVQQDYYFDDDTGYVFRTHV